MKHSGSRVLAGLIALGLCVGCGSMFSSGGSRDAGNVAEKVAWERFRDPAQKHIDAGEVDQALAVWRRLEHDGPTDRANMIKYGEFDRQWGEIESLLDERIESALAAMSWTEAEELAGRAWGLDKWVGDRPRVWMEDQIKRVEARKSGGAGDEIQTAEAKGLHALAWCLRAGKGDIAGRDAARRRFQESTMPVYALEATGAAAGVGRALAAETLPVGLDPSASQKLTVRIEGLKIEGFDEVEGRSSNKVLFRRPVPKDYAANFPAERDAMMSHWSDVEAFLKEHTEDCTENLGGMSTDQCRAQLTSLKQPFLKAKGELERKLRGRDTTWSDGVEWQSVTREEDAGGERVYTLTAKATLVVELPGVAPLRESVGTGVKSTSGEPDRAALDERFEERVAERIKFWLGKQAPNPKGPLREKLKKLPSGMESDNARIGLLVLGEPRERKGQDGGWLMTRCNISGSVDAALGLD